MSTFPPKAISPEILEFLFDKTNISFIVLIFKLLVKVIPSNIFSKFSPFAKKRSRTMSLALSSAITVIPLSLEITARASERIMFFNSSSCSSFIFFKGTFSILP